MNKQEVSLIDISNDSSFFGTLLIVSAMISLKEMRKYSFLSQREERVGVSTNADV